MRASDKDALLCDFAQYYHIYDLDALAPGYAAVLACGLPEDSRIMKKKAGTNAGLKELLLAAIVDNLRCIKNGLAGTNDSQQSLVSLLTGTPQKSETGQAGFDTPEEFEAARKRILEG